MEEDACPGKQVASWASLVTHNSKESACNVGDLDSIPGLGRSPGEGKVYLLRYSGLENSMEYIVHGVAKSRTQLSNWTELNLLLYLIQIFKSNAAERMEILVSSPHQLKDTKYLELEARVLGKISITSDMQMIQPLWQKEKRNWRASWWKWKRRVKNLD